MVPFVNIDIERMWMSGSIRSVWSVPFVDIDIDIARMWIYKDLTLK